MTEASSDLPLPPQDPQDLAGFPVRTWRAQQPLARIHQQTHAPLFFAHDPGGRFNPPDPDAAWGTCSLSTHPMGAFLEVFARLRRLTPEDLDRRVLTEFYPESDLLLADLTSPVITGRYRVTNEISAGPRSGYPLTEAWAAALHDAGFAGLYYLPRHDTSLQYRSIALFGKAGVDEHAGLQPTPIPDRLVHDAVHEHGFTLINRRPL